MTGAEASGLPVLPFLQLQTKISEIRKIIPVKTSGNAFFIIKRRCYFGSYISELKVEVIHEKPYTFIQRFISFV
jgi:hypothetical protein